MTSTTGQLELRLAIPPTPEHLRAARLVAADAAGRAGLDCDAADDLRIAVDELCHSIMRVSDEPIQLAFDVSQGRVAIEVATLAGPPSETVLSPLSETIVRSVTDLFEPRDGAELSYVVVKLGEPCR
jgi:serine/threonine-protein kinase RsbW